MAVAHSSASVQQLCSLRLSWREGQADILRDGTIGREMGYHWQKAFELQSQHLPCMRCGGYNHSSDDPKCPKLKAVWHQQLQESTHVRQVLAGEAPIEQDPILDRWKATALGCEPTDFIVQSSFRIPSQAPSIRGKFMSMHGPPRFGSLHEGGPSLGGPLREAVLAEDASEEEDSSEEEVFEIEENLDSALGLSPQKHTAEQRLGKIIVANLLSGAHKSLMKSPHAFRRLQPPVSPLVRRRKLRNNQAHSPGSKLHHHHQQDQQHKALEKLPALVREPANAKFVPVGADAWVVWVRTQVYSLPAEAFFSESFSGPSPSGTSPRYVR